MKKIIGSALLALTGLTAQAQTSAGTIVVGGAAGYSSSNSTGSSSNKPAALPNLQNENRGWILAPKVGYFVADKLAVGLSVDASHGRYTEQGYDLSSSPVVQERVSTMNRVEIAPFVRYYHMLGEKVGFFGQLSGGYLRGKGNSTATSSTYAYQEKRTGSFARLAPGFVFFPTTKLGLELIIGNLGYSATTTEYLYPQPYNEKYTLKEKGLGANFNLSSVLIGGHFYLGGQ